MTSEKKSLFKKVLVIIIAAIIAFSAVSMAATKIIYDSIFTRYDAPNTQTPATLSNLIEDRATHQYFSGENRLSGYLYRSDLKNGENALIVIAPGFRAAESSYLWQIKSLLSYGWSVFTFDPTGSCSSQGRSAIGFSQELCDLEATLKYIEQNDNFGYNDIILLGHSRGGYAACCALEGDFDIAAAISISGINSAMEGVMSSAESRVGPLAYGNWGFLWLYQALLFGADRVNLSAHDAINQSDVPVLIIHGDDDDQVSAERFSIYSHKDDISSDTAKFLLMKKDGQDGHTSLLFDKNGQANSALMAEINDFLHSSLA